MLGARSEKPMRFGQAGIASLLTRPIDGWNFLGGVLLIGLCGYLLSNFLPLSSKAMNNVFYIGCALPAAVWGVKHRSEVMAWLRAGYSLWLFLLMLAASALLMDDAPGEAKAAIYVSLLGLAILALHRWDARAEQWLFSWLAVLAVAAFGWATYAWVVAYQPGSVPPRIQLWGKTNPNETALMIVAAWVFLWEFWFEPSVKRMGNLAYWLGAIIFCLLVVWSAVAFQSRSTLLGFGAYLSLKLVMDDRRWYLLSGLLAVIAVAWMQNWHQGLEVRGYSFRPEIWSDAWQRLTQVCGLLAGCGNDGHAFAGNFAHAHSAYLMILYERGLAVFLLFVLFTLVFFGEGVRYRSRWMLVAAVGWGGILTTTGGVVHSPQPFWIYFWMPTFLAMLECWSYRRKNQGTIIK